MLLDPGECCDCGEEPPGNCIPYSDVVEFGVNPWCVVRVYVTDGVGTGWYTGVESCSSEPGWLGVWSVRLIDRMPFGMMGIGSIRYSDFVLDGGTYCLLAEPTTPPSALTICVRGCDGEPIPGALVKAWSDDDSGPFNMPPAPEGSDLPLTTDDSGCITFGIPSTLDADALITVFVNAPPEYQATTVEATRNVIEFADGGFVVEPDVEPNHTCCDIDFRMGPVNPSNYPTTPRGVAMECVTSLGTSRTVEVGVDGECDGSTCTLSDDLGVVGGAPVKVTCPPGGEAPWDYWYPPTLNTGRVPIKARFWYDGDWHAELTVYHTIARPPDALNACVGDPSLNVTDQWGWIRSDGECYVEGGAVYSVPPDPELDHPYGIGDDGGSWYSGVTKEIKIVASSYTVGANNPVDVTFYFPAVALFFHGGNVLVKIVDSITLWQSP